MKLILLPGNSSHNKIWIEEVEKKLKDLFYETKIQYYSHWKDNKNIDCDLEVSKLTKIVNNLGEHIIFAKSIGTYLVLRAISKNKIKPKKILFIGFPYKIFSKR